MAHAMEKDEAAPTPKNYATLIQQIVEMLKKDHPGPSTLYYLYGNSQEQDTLPLVKKVILWRKKGKTIDEGLEVIRQFNWKSETALADARALKGVRKTAIFAHYLEIANAALGVDWQEVNEEGNLVTTFAREESFSRIECLYNQVPEIEEITRVPNSEEK